MRIAIDPSPNNFSDRFISYCQEHKIEYQLVSSTSSDFIEKIRAFDIFMWHPSQGDYAQMQYGKHLTITLEKMGIKVFPDVATFYHFDDKIAETFLLQACNIPVVPGHIFYKKPDAVEWAKKAAYPQVFKQRGGASSVNVQLVHSQKHALKLIDIMFSTAMDGYGRFSRFKDTCTKFFQYKATFRSVLSALKVYDSCEGYWTPDMVWHPGCFNPQYWIMENIISLKTADCR